MQTRGKKCVQKEQKPKSRGVPSTVTRTQHQGSTASLPQAQPKWKMQTRLPLLAAHKQAQLSLPSPGAPGPVAAFSASVPTLPHPDGL